MADDIDPAAPPGAAPAQADIMAANYGAEGAPAAEAGRAPTTEEAAGQAPTTVHVDVQQALAFLNACETSHPRVGYKLGAKIKSGQVPGRDFTAVDCSGFVREVMRRSTSLGGTFPDGSVVQHDWVKAKGFAPTTVNAAKQADGLVRIAFLSPTATKSRIGHVVIVHNAKTIESHGGVGPDSRVWNGTAWQASTTVFVLDPSSQASPQA